MKTITKHLLNLSLMLLTGLPFLSFTQNQPVEDLTLTSFCSFDDIQERWRVINPNSFEVDVTWLVVSTDATGGLKAPPGATFFFTPSDGGSNTTKIFWLDENEVEQETVKASQNTICDPDPDPDPLDCEDYAAFYVDNAQGAGNGVLYGVSFSGSTATFDHLTDLNYKAHLSYDPIGEKLYVNNSNGQFIEIFDTAGNSMGIIDISSAGLSGVINNAYSRGYVYLGSGSQNRIVRVDVLTGDVEPWATGLPISGGDLAFRDGLLYLATRSGRNLWQVNPGDNQKVFVGKTVRKVNGMALGPDNDNFVMTNSGKDEVFIINPTNGETEGSYAAVMDNEPFELFNGDLASGCSDNNGGGDPDECSQYVAYYADHLGDVSDIFGVSFSGSDATFTKITTRDYEVHLAYNSNDGYIYAIDADNATLERIDPEFGTGEAVGLLPAVGQEDLGKVTAITYERGRLWIGSDANDAVYVTNVFGAADMSLEYTYVQDAPVAGGDIAWKDGRLFVATRKGNELRRLDAGNTTSLVSGIAAKVTGLAVSESNNFLITNRDSEYIIALDNDGNVVNEYRVGGAIEVLRNGDFSSGCQDGGAGDPFCFVSEVINPGAEDGPEFNGSYVQYSKEDTENNPSFGWLTTSSIEVQRSGDINGVASHCDSGFHFELLSRNRGDNMYQVLDTDPGSEVFVVFYYRKRPGASQQDEMELRVGNADGFDYNYENLNDHIVPFSTSSMTWQRVEYSFQAVHDQTIVMFKGLEGSTQSVGNLLDDIYIGCDAAQAVDPCDPQEEEVPTTRLDPSVNSGVDNIIVDDSRVMVYPVPAVSELNIKVDNSGAKVEGTYHIMNMSGRTSHQGTITIIDGESDVLRENVSNLPEGMYFLVMNLNGKQITKQFVKVSQ